MKKLTCVLWYLFITTCASYASKPTVLFSYCTFDNPSGKPFIEVYLGVAANSVTVVKKTDGKYQGTIQVQLLLRKEKAIVYADKYNLNSPLSDKEVLANDFNDMQRIPVDNGTYTLELNITDRNSETIEAFIVSQEITLDYPSDHISISGIELLDAYSKQAGESRFIKNGVEMIPTASNFYPPSKQSIKFYAEIYHASEVFGLDSNFVVRYRLDGYESKKTAENLGGTYKVKAKEVNVFLAEIPISTLQSGNYNIVVEVVNKENIVLAAKKMFVQRANQVLIPLALEDISAIKTEGTFVEKITSIDSLKECILCLYPVSDNSEQYAGSAQVKLAEKKSMQQYLLYFWLHRNQQNPEAVYKEYMVMVDAVNTSFTTYNKKGYETDRGRVYLQYGPPNERATSYNEPQTNPYEIWHYYKLKNQSNRKFVFLSNNRASNDFDLIHSDATGEVNQPKWEAMLETNPQNFGVDKYGRNSPDYFGKQSKDLFDTPH